MQYDSPLTIGKLIVRYKRFLADVELPDGSVITAHVPNTGSMLGTRAAGSPVALSYHDNPKRKLAWTLELIKPIETNKEAWVCVNTIVTNKIVHEAIEKGRIGPLRGYDSIRREVPYGDRSRVDLLLSRREHLCYVEVKNVTLRQGKKALFPDAVTERGTRHLRELEAMAAEGHRAVIFFLVNRRDCTSMGPAADIDPLYTKTLKEVLANGVEAMAYRTSPNLEGIEIDKKLRIQI